MESTGSVAVPDDARRLGRDVRLLRLSGNWTQAELAARAGVSLRSVKDLERGAATLRTLVRVVAVLGRNDWLAMLTINFPPGLTAVVTRVSSQRQRARRPASS